MAASLRLMGQDLRETCLAVGIGEFERTEDGDAHPFLALKIRAVVERMGLGSNVLLWMPLGLQGISDRLNM
jgi:hypothetical protein